MTDEERQRYAYEVWSELFRLNGEVERLMSPREWTFLKRLLDEDIPLRIVLRGMQDCRKRGSTLLYYEPSIRVAINSWSRGVQ